MLVIESLSKLSDLVLEVSSLSLELNTEFSHLPIEHTLPLAFHHQPEIIKLLSLALLTGHVPLFPPVNLSNQLVIACPLHIELILHSEVNLRVFPFELLKFSVELMANHVKLLIFLLIFCAFHFVAEKLLSELSYLHFVILGVEYLSFEVLDLYTVGLDLQGKALNFHRLEYHHELQVAAEVGPLRSAGKVGDAGSE